MQPFRLFSAAGQVAAFLRAEVERGHWTEEMPGADYLATALGVNRKTVEAALRRLEQEGVLAGQGAGRKRRIILAAGERARPLRVAILNFEPMVFTEGYIIELQHLLVEAGHSAFFAERSLTELGMKVSRISRLVEKTEADAWVVYAASREVLEWFVARSVPAIALFGRRRGLPIAAVGPDKVPAYAAATRRLIELGHRRIVLLCRQMRRLPVPGTAECVFLAELAAHEIPSSPYNLPDWEESVEGFQARLESLFRVTPPTALIIDELPFFVAAQQFLARRGIRVPEDVSMVCTDANPAFAWCVPSVAHIGWDSRPVVRRIVRWAANVSHGEKDLRQTLTPAKFVEGGTIGPAKK
jgi:DNA-binding LacI/PurR family transcriptional regulator